MIAFSESQLTTNNSATDNSPLRDRLTRSECNYRAGRTGRRNARSILLSVYMEASHAPSLHHARRDHAMMATVGSWK